MKHTVWRANRPLIAAYEQRLGSLDASARRQLSRALFDLRSDALERAELQWRRHKAPMAHYWRMVGVYAGQLARSVRPEGRMVKPAGHCAGGAGIREAAQALAQRWQGLFGELDADVAAELRSGLMDLRAVALERADRLWRRRKSEQAYYAKVVGVYAGHMARAAAAAMARQEGKIELQAGEGEGSPSPTL